MLLVLLINSCPKGLFLLNYSLVMSLTISLWSLTNRGSPSHTDIGITFRPNSNHSLIVNLSVRSCENICHLAINHLALPRHSKNAGIRLVKLFYVWKKWNLEAF